METNAVQLRANRKGIPPNDTVCGACYAQLKSPALLCHKCNCYYHPTCAQMPLYYMVRYVRSHITFVCKKCMEDTTTWTETAQLFMDCYPFFTPIESSLDKCGTEVQADDNLTKSPISNIEETSSENAEVQLILTDENEHQIVWQDSTSRETTEDIKAETGEPKQERTSLQTKMNKMSKFSIKRSCQHNMKGEKCKLFHPLPCMKYGKPNRWC